MTAIAAAVRPGLGWVAMLAVGILLAGTGFLLVVLPFDGDVESARDTGRADRRIQCPTPLARAFDDVGGVNAGWFELRSEPAIGIAGSWCAISARTRVKSGVLALAIGLAGTTVAARRLDPPR